MTATRLFLVRHGATELSAEDRFAGATDVPLSDEGRAQATRLGERLRDDRVVAVYCSPLQRTRATASLLRPRTGSPLSNAPACGRSITADGKGSRVARSRGGSAASTRDGRRTRSPLRRRAVNPAST
jgi:phosphohistidine phosphatase SixA